MAFLKFLEGIRTDAGDFIVSLLTHMGGEAFFLALVVIFYWCISKNEGYRLLVTSFAGIACNQFMKLIFRIPRPWVLDPELTIVESARADATGYSFPSGHTTNITAVGTALFLDIKKPWLRVICVLAIAIVAFSRMYLGVHTPLDVLVGFGTTAVIAIVVHKLFNAIENKPMAMYWVLVGVLALSAIYLLYTCLWPFPADVDMDNLIHGRETACTMLGATLGFGLGYHLDRTRIHFSEKAPLPAQFIKTILGLAILIALKSLLKSPLNAALGIYFGRAVRYFIVGAFAAAVWPMTFKKISAIFGKKA